MKDFYKFDNKTPSAFSKQLPLFWRAILVLLVGLMFMSSAALGQAVSPGIVPATPPSGGFSIDGDLIANTPANTGDWLQGTIAGSGGSVLDATGEPKVASTTFHSEDLYTSGDNIFAGGQKKNDNPNLMTWINGNPSPAKNDINNFMMHRARATNGDVWITLSGDRESTSGNSFISIALHQKKLELLPSGKFSSAASNETGGRTLGDVQVSAEFTGGGSSPNLYLEEWKSVGGVYQWVAIPVPLGSAFGKTNASVINGVPYDAFGTNSYPVNAFIEVAFNISEIFRSPSTPCVGSIASMFVMTKSSQSVPANMTDFVDPLQINLDINITLTVQNPAAVCTQANYNLANAITSSTTGLTISYYDVDPRTNPSATPLTSSTITTSVTKTYYIKASSNQQSTCADVKAVTVTVNPAPGTPILAAVQPTCTLATGKITITSATTGLKFSLNGAPYADYPAGGYTVSAGDYTISAQNAAGCISADASKTIDPQPAAPASPLVKITEASLCGPVAKPFITICSPAQDAIYKLTQPGIAGFKEVGPYTGTELKFTDLVNGIGFSITATIGNCTSESTNCGNADENTCPAPPPPSAKAPTESDLAVTAETPMTAYPIPFSDRATLEFKSLKDEDYVINLYDLKGNLVKQLKSGKAKIGEVIRVEVDGSKMAESIYLARKMSKTGVSTIKLLKKR